ncbi:peptidase domain-containing ABC transporter, partial [Allosphingosinicella sp.]|uniref:peptidase domain-containing ABC transporter n=1 Tax=Allosphingosinicella sp. TaxID=2823234 RepID=UPI002EE93032
VRALARSERPVSEAPGARAGSPSGRRIRPIRQAEAAECGLAALAMVANHWGHDLDIAALRRRFGISSRGTGLRSLMNAADSLGLAPRPVKLGLDGLAGLQLPAILHWDMDHFVVLERVARGRAYIVDPAGDGRWHGFEAVSKHFTGVALELRPAPGFAPARERNSLRLGELWSRSTGLGRSILQAVLLSVVLQAYVLASPFLLQLAVDEALANLDTQLMTKLALAFALFAIVYATAMLLRSLVLLGAGTALSFGIASNVARRLMRLPVGWFEKRSVGDILSRFQSVVPIQRLLTESAAGALIDGVLAVLTFAMMLAYSPLLALVPLGSLLLYAAFRAATLPAERRAENERIAAAGREQSALIETLRGMVTLRLAGRETVRHAFWQNRLSQALSASFAHERIQVWQACASLLLGALEIVLLVWLAITMSIEGSFTVGMVFAFLAYRMQFAAAAKSLVDTSSDFRMLRLHLDRLSDIALTEEDRGFAEPDRPSHPLRGEIELRGIVYSYGADEPRVLNGVHLHVAPGEHLAITGPSGGGKTTLAKIVLGLVDPDEGQVLVDGMPLADYGRRAFREQVAAVLQDDVLFAGTIADNVAGFETIDEDRMTDALRAAAIADDVEAMPMGRLTLVGDMGSTLSGGQMQRILLARALYRRPRLLVMDEGTAYLDAEHEKDVNVAISALGVTRIVIAHRRETLAAADRVVTLAGGRIPG